MNTQTQPAVECRLDGIVRPLREGELMAAYMDFDRRADKTLPPAEYLLRFAAAVSSATVKANALPKGVDLQQIIYALERQERALQAHADRLSAAMDYSAEFPAEDAERMREAVALLRPNV